ncbi:hypothetical protein ACFLXI_04110 [Chloroflexota bacterium]
MTRWYPDLAEHVLKCLYARTQPSLRLFVEGAGHLPDWDIILMQTAYCIEPIRLSPALLIERVPYTRPESFCERLSATARRGWLQEEDGNFYLTNGGREIVEGVYELSDRLCAKIKTLTVPEIVRLLSQHDRIIEKIKQLPEPLRKPAFEFSLHFDRDKCAPPIVQVCQRILVLLAFRDDAHIAAWRPYEPDGQLWEVFTLIWREQAGIAAELVEQLAHRNYAVSDYAAALEELAARGWIANRGGKFVVQEQAAQMRQKVESTTDRTFADAFTCLSLIELRKFRDLMGKFAEAVCA